MTLKIQPQTSTLAQGRKSKDAGDGKKTQNILGSTQAIQAKKSFENDPRKFYPLDGRKHTRTNQQPNIKEVKEFWSKIWERKEYNTNPESINNMKKELEKIEIVPEVNIHQASCRATLKQITNFHKEPEFFLQMIEVQIMLSNQNFLIRPTW